MKIASWNVNSLNVRMNHLADWLQSAEPDVLALQETKMEDHKFPSRELEDLGYEAAFIGQKSYNGVAILSKHPLTDVQSEFDDVLNAPDQRRVLAATVAHPLLGELRIVNVYIVNGQALGSEKFEFKMRWLKALQHSVKEQLARYPNLVLLGDFNIAPEDIDCYDPAGWSGQIHCSEDERAALRRLQALGLEDSLRCVDSAQHFSWWDYRQASFRRNLGLRIDLALISPPVKAQLQSAGIDSAPRAQESPSDHAPIWLSLSSS